MRSGDSDVELAAGAGFLVPRGTAHTYWNPRQQRVRYLLIMTPNIYRLIQEIHTTQNRTSQFMQALFERFDSEFLA